MSGSDLLYIRDGKFHLDFEVGTENSVFFGAHWNGKTFTATNQIVRPLLGHYPLLVWDAKGRIVEELLQQRMTPEQQRLVMSGSVRSVSQIKTSPCFVRRAPESEFDAFCRFANAQYDCHVVIDEVHKFNNAHRIPPWLHELVAEKGNDNVSYTCIFQRPAENHKALISNAQHRFCFMLDVPTDVLYLRSLIGTEVELFLPPNSPMRRFYKEAPQLPLRSFIYRNTKEPQAKIVVGGLKI